MATSVQDLRQRQQGTMVAERPRHTIIDLLNNPKTKAGLAVVAGKMLNPERILKIATNAISRTPQLAQCNPKSVLGSIMASTALGLEFNTPLGHAYLIPYKRCANVDGQWIDVYDCQFQIGYKGWIVLAHRSPVVESLDAEAIHKGDFFDHMKGSEAFLKFKKSLEDRGPLIGAYCHTRHGGHNEAATVLPLDDILKIRGRSETFRALERGVRDAQTDRDKAKAQQKFDDQPWVLWEDDMAAKSAIKKHMKLLPITPGDPVSAALQLDGAGDAREGDFIDLAALSDPDVARDVQDGGDAPITSADATEEQAGTGGETSATQAGAEAGATQATGERQGRGNRRGSAPASGGGVID
jgi:recombination protein RecT